MTKTKKSLVESYTLLAGKAPCPTVHASILKISDDDSLSSYDWEPTGNKDIPYKLIESHPFGDGFVVPNQEINFGPNAAVNEEDYQAHPFDMEGSPQGDVSTNIPVSIEHHRILKEIMPPESRDKLLINHNSGDSSSSMAVLDGFGIDNLLECYAERMSDETVCSYLQIRPSQLKRWIATSTQRLAMVQRLQDILRSQNINNVIGDALEYETGEVFDKASAAYEALKMDAMKMKSKVALDLEGRARVKDPNDGPSLPVVQLGLQVNVGSNQRDDSNEIFEAKPMLPSIP